MRTAALSILLAAALAAPAAVLGADQRAGNGTLSVEQANGTIKVTARGGVLGRMSSGSIQFFDLTPDDRWFPVVNGIGRGVFVSYRGDEISFRLLGGQYRLVVRGKGISISARGAGSAMLDGEADQAGLTGIWAVGADADCGRAPDKCARIPDVPRRILFGPPAPQKPSPVVQP
jgi:hypothetical protein